MLNNFVVSASIFNLTSRNCSSCCVLSNAHGLEAIGGRFQEIQGVKDWVCVEIVGVDLIDCDDVGIEERGRVVEERRAKRRRRERFLLIEMN